MTPEAMAEIPLRRPTVPPLRAADGPPVPAPRPARWRRAVLVADPALRCAAARAPGRTRLGLRRRLDADLAREQWDWLCDLLRDRGLRVIVEPADPGVPSLARAAHAGFLDDLDGERPPGEKTFHLSDLGGARAGERERHERVLRAAGFRVSRLPAEPAFRGEVDFFPVGDVHVLAYAGERLLADAGRAARRRERTTPPGATDPRAAALLAPLVAPRPLLPVELVLPTHPHGDMALCGFGPQRRHVLVWPRAITPESLERLRGHFGERLIELGDDDALRGAANAFAYTPPGQDGIVFESMLFLPSGVSPRLLDRIRERGVAPIAVEVSVLAQVFGGSVKCLLADLGPLPDLALDAPAAGPVRACSTRP